MHKNYPLCKLQLLDKIYEAKERVYMLKNSPLNTQDMFLQYIFKNDVDVCVFLVNGIKLSGKIAGYDQYSLVLNNSLIENNSMLIYKHAISTIVPQRDITNVETSFS